MDIKTPKTNKKPVAAPAQAEATPAKKEPGMFAKIGKFFTTAFNYGYAGLKVVDVVARIATAAALYLKLNDAILNWGAAFLAATAVWEIVVALLRAYGPNRK